MRWNACVHRLDFGLYSHLEDFGGNGVRTHVNFKGKIPSNGKNTSPQRIEPTTNFCIQQTYPFWSWNATTFTYTVRHAKNLANVVTLSVAAMNEEEGHHPHPPPPPPPVTSQPHRSPFISSKPHCSQQIHKTTLSRNSLCSTHWHRYTLFLKSVFLSRLVAF